MLQAWSWSRGDDSVQGSRWINQTGPSPSSFKVVGEGVGLKIESLIETKMRVNVNLEKSLITRKRFYERAVV